MRKTKIVCTLGPSTDREGVLREMLLAGMNVARFNFSHGSHEEHKARLDKLKALREELNLPVAAMLDTKGPEVRLKTFADGSDAVYKYFVCSICPVKAPTLELKYSNEDSEFHSASTGHIALAPELGFLFPAFDDRAANIYNALFYSKNAAELHQEVIDAVFRVAEPPMSAEEQKNIFSTALGDTLQKDCSYDVVQSVHEQLRGRIDEHKESKDPQPLTLSVREVGDMLSGSGVSAEKVEAFQQECRKQYGEDAELNPKNIIESGKFQITTPEVKIAVAPEYSYMIEARVIDGRKYILIPADDGVEINGIGVNIPNPQNTAE